MSTPTLRAALLAAAAGASALLGIPLAAADNDLSGTYKYNSTSTGDQSGVFSRTWTITSCGTGCAHVVASASGGDTGYTGDMHLANGRWEMTLQRPDISTCIDGRKLPGTYTYSLDPATLRGTATGKGADDCTGKPYSDQAGFTLVRT
jgi:hypothetical protein